MFFETHCTHRIRNASQNSLLDIHRHPFEYTFLHSNISPHRYLKLFDIVRLSLDK